jgi:hypothetical protein
MGDYIRPKTQTDYHQGIFPDSPTLILQFAYSCFPQLLQIQEIWEKGRMAFKSLIGIHGTRVRVEALNTSIYTEHKGT